MYFKFSLRHNPATDQPDCYYRLVESYRNEYNRVCHRTLLNIGFVDLEVETLNKIRRILQERLDRKTPLFEETDELALKWADYYWYRHTGILACKHCEIPTQTTKNKSQLARDNQNNKHPKNHHYLWTKQR